jgi:hypothetical protein
MQCLHKLNDSSWLVIVVPYQNVYTYIHPITSHSKSPGTNPCFSVRPCLIPLALFVRAVDDHWPLKPMRGTACSVIRRSPLSRFGYFSLCNSREQDLPVTFPSTLFYSLLNQGTNNSAKASKATKVRELQIFF